MDRLGHSLLNWFGRQHAEKVIGLQFMSINKLKNRLSGLVSYGFFGNI